MNHNPKAEYREAPSQYVPHRYILETTAPTMSERYWCEPLWECGEESGYALTLEAKFNYSSRLKSVNCTVYICTITCTAG
jgi:hypothetical protein